DRRNRAQKAKPSSPGSRVSLTTIAGWRPSSSTSSPSSAERTEVTWKPARTRPNCIKPRVEGCGSTTSTRREPSGVRAGVRCSTNPRAVGCGPAIAGAPPRAPGWECMRLAPPPASGQPRGSANLAHLLGKLLRVEVAEDARVVEDLPVRGDEGHGGKPVDPEAGIERVHGVGGVGAVGLDPDEAAPLGDHLGRRISPAVELLAGRTPLGEEIDDHRAMRCPGLRQGPVEGLGSRPFTGVAD